MQDSIGDEYTLLRLGGTRADTSALEGAMRRLKAPFQVRIVKDAAPRDVYGYDLILLRPDMHIAWRGNTPPSDSEHLAALITGH